MRGKVEFAVCAGAGLRLATVHRGVRIGTSLAIGIAIRRMIRDESKGARNRRMQRAHGQVAWTGVKRKYAPAWCSNKVRFPHEHHAKARARDITKKGTPLYASPCVACMGFHLTRHPDAPRTWSAAMKEAARNWACMVPSPQ